MSEIKTLELRKISIDDKGTFRYEVVENNKVIAKRISIRNYVSCYVTKYEYLDHPSRKIGDPPVNIYNASYFFSRKDLMSKGDSRHFLTSPNAYAIAYLKNSQS